MRLGIGEVQRFGAGGNRADQPLPHGKPRQMHRGFFKPFAGEQFENIAGAQQVDRAHFRIEPGGNQRHHLVQPRLRAGSLRHDVADLPQKRQRRNLDFSFFASLEP